jgi:hypothetical protein
MGLFTDKMSPKTLIPFCLAMRAANSFAIYQVTNLDEQYYLALISLSFFHAVEKLVVVSMQGYLIKLYPQEIRAICG